MTILVTNDDGVGTEGLRQLCAAVRRMGEVVVVVPDRQRSGSSHSITTAEPLRLTETEALDGLTAYLTNGTPADCVALGVGELAKGAVNLVISGINHGWNLGMDTSYSGTVMAAAEASVLSLPAMAVSVGGREASRFATAAYFARSIAESVLREGMPSGTFLNINVPDLPSDEIEGVAVTSLSRWTYCDNFDKRTDPHGGTYFWRGGNSPVRFTAEGKVEHNAPPGTDAHAVFQGFVSVTPLRLDFTDGKSLKAMRPWLEVAEHSLKRGQNKAGIVASKDGSSEKYK